MNNGSLLGVTRIRYGHSITSAIPFDPLHQIRHPTRLPYAPAPGPGTPTPILHVPAIEIPAPA